MPIKWWPRLEREALGPLAERGEAVFGQTDWVNGAPRPPIRVAPTDVVILEGVSSGRRAVTDRSSVLVWIETPAHVRLARGLERDGKSMTDAWSDWMAEEDAHYAIDQTIDRADLVVDGAPAIHHDADAAFVVIDR